MVGVLVGLWVVSDVFGCGVALRVTGYALATLRLVDANVIDAHDGRQHGRDLSKVDGCETVGHAEVGYNGKRLLRNDSSSNVASSTCSRGLHRPRLLITYVPGDESIAARLVLESVLLVLLTIIPIGIQVGQTRNSLLVRSALVRVHHRDRIVVNLHLFCCMSVDHGDLVCEHLP